MKKIGFFGGTFDPPHLGHLILAAEAFFQLELDALHWILTPNPPHKTELPLTPVETRVDLLNLVIKVHPGFFLSLIDLNRESPYYAADTAALLRAEYPSSKLVYIIGEDSLVDLPRWVDPSRLLTQIDQLAVAPRPNAKSNLAELTRILPDLAEKTVYLTGPMIQISSTQIRERIRNKEPFSHFLTPAVYQYLEKNKPYQ